MDADTIKIFAIGFAGCFVAISTHITFNSIYSLLFVNNRITRSRVFVSIWFWLTSLANFAQYFRLGSFGCVFAAKFSVITFHLQMLSGEAFQMYRISVITGRNKIFVGLSIALIILRALVAISDLVLSTSNPLGPESPEGQEGLCVFVQELYSGVIHVAMDAIVELFITTAITVALFHHTRDLMRLQRKSSNYNLYKIIVETNIFRTIILFLINLLTMFIIMFDPHAVILTYMWSLMGIVYLYFVIYDKGMVRFLHQIAKGSSRQHNDKDGFHSEPKNDNADLNLNIAIQSYSTQNETVPRTQSSQRELIFPYLESGHTFATSNDNPDFKETEMEAFDPQPPKIKNNDGFPSSIEEWAQYYLGKLDQSSSRGSLYTSPPPINLPI